MCQLVLERSKISRSLSRSNLKSSTMFPNNFNNFNQNLHNFIPVKRRNPQIPPSTRAQSTLPPRASFQHNANQTPWSAFSSLFIQRDQFVDPNAILRPELRLVGSVNPRFTQDGYWDSYWQLVKEQHQKGRTLFGRKNSTLYGTLTQSLES